MDANSSRASLLLLPPELRSIIFDHLFSPAYTFTVTPQLNKFMDKPPPLPHSALAVLLTYRVLYAECRERVKDLPLRSVPAIANAQSDRFVSPLSSFIDGANGSTDKSIRTLKARSLLPHFALIKTLWICGQLRELFDVMVRKGEQSVLASALPAVELVVIQGWHNGLVADLMLAFPHLRRIVQMSLGGPSSLAGGIADLGPWRRTKNGSSLCRMMRISLDVYCVDWRQAEPIEKYRHIHYTRCLPDEAAFTATESMEKVCREGFF